MEELFMKIELKEMIEESKKIQNGLYNGLTDMSETKKRTIQEKYEKVLEGLELNEKRQADIGKLAKEIEELSSYMLANYNGRHFERISKVYYQELDKYSVHDEEVTQPLEELKYLLINYQEYIEEFETLNEVFGDADFEIVARVILDANIVFEINLEEGDIEYKRVLKYTALKRYKKSLQKIEKIRCKEVKDMLITYLNYFSPLEK